VRAASRLWWQLRRPLLLRQLRNPSVTEVRGMPMVVLPAVHHPVVFRSGVFLADTILDGDDAAPPPDRDGWALDMGTGSGVGALAAACRGFRVVAVDVDPAAVRCASANAALNGVASRVEVRQGDLFEAVEDRRFDLVTFNPPFYAGRPSRSKGVTWRSPDVLSRFADGLPVHLAAGGRAIVVFSTDGDASAFEAAFDPSVFDVTVVAERPFANELMTAYRIAAPS
jgi:methylase of polypeptide subunit release factors